MTQTVKFSSAQDPRSWDPHADFGADVVITCMTNADAKRAELLYKDLLARAEAAEAKLARPEEGECEACAAWNLVCPKCGAAKGGECGWPTNCPTGQNLKSPQPQPKENQ